MLRDITIGQYYPSGSFIHRLDPRTKIIASFVYIIALFLAGTYLGFAPVVLFFIVTVVISKVPFSYIVKGLKPIVFIILITVIFNFFMSKGEVIFRFWFLKVTKEGVKRGVFLALRLMLLMLGTSMLTFTTTPNQLTDGMEKVFGFLKVIKVPVQALAMMMSIALRFIPILLDETDKIMKAQMARGADFESGNIFRRAKAMIPIFIPLIISAFRRAFELAQAMEARCYHGGEGRTRLNPMRYKRRDAYAYVSMALLLAAAIVIRKVA